MDTALCEEERSVAGLQAKKQTSLLSYLSSKPGTKKKEPPGNCVRTSVAIPDTSRTAHIRNSRKSCPFYKKIPGTSFSVDAFQYGSITGCTVYFLTHFHSDHYRGLNRSFKHDIYCSQVTGNLVQQQLKTSGGYIHPLALNEPLVIEDVEVTFLDANHCPGSVLILFKLKSGQNFLHTGDFRFSPSMLNYPQLVGLTIHQLYLDTTYCNPRYDFPAQEQVVAFAVEQALNALHASKDTLLVCGTYTIGKERVFSAIAEVLGIKACVSKEKKSIISCLESPGLSDLVSTDYNESSLHILPMGKLNVKDLSCYLDKWKSKFSRLVAFKPTGWTHSEKTSNLSTLKPVRYKEVMIYGIPYSEHSSFTELKQSIQGWKPLKVIPTVNNGSAHERAAMQRTFQSWLNSTNSLVQTNLKKYLKNCQIK